MVLPFYRSTVGPGVQRWDHSFLGKARAQTSKLELQFRRTLEAIYAPSVSTLIPIYINPRHVTSPLNSETSTSSSFTAAVKMGLHELESSKILWKMIHWGGKKISSNCQNVSANWSNLFLNCIFAILPLFALSYSWFARNNFPPQGSVNYFENYLRDSNCVWN